MIESISDDDSNKSIDYDSSAKKLAQDFKTFIKSHNAEYAEKLKAFLGENFSKYHEVLSNNLNDQLSKQESKQNKVQDKIDKCNRKIKNMEEKVFKNI